MRKLILLFLNVLLFLLAGVNVHAMPLHSAVRNGDAERVKALISAGADLNARTEYGKTPLYLAVGAANEIVKLLIDAGADTKAKDRSGKTPLYWVKNGHKYVTSVCQRKSVFRFFLGRNSEFQTNPAYHYIIK